MLKYISSDGRPLDMVNICSPIRPWIWWICWIWFQLIINLVDINDNYPMFPLSQYIVQGIAETVPNGSHIIQGKYLKKKIVYLIFTNSMQTCNSVTFYLMKNSFFSDVSMKWILANMISIWYCCSVCWLRKPIDRVQMSEVNWSNLSAT